MNKTKEALKMAIEALEKVTFEYGQLLDGDQDYGLLPSETNEDIVIAHRVIRICKEALAEQPLTRDWKETIAERSNKDDEFKEALAEQLSGNSEPLSDDEVKCSTHPDAPHGFCRNASHSANRYVCECEGWEREHGIGE